MRFSVVAAGVLAVILPACATFIGGSESDRYETGLAALRAGDFVRARENLAWVAENKSGEEIGRRALLVVSAIDMDPRNPVRRLAQGSDLVATYMRNDRADKWTDPVAQTLYLLALELGAADDKVMQAEADKQAAQREAAAVENALSSWPALPKGSTSASSKIKSLTEQTDKLSKRVDQLESQVKEQTTKLAEKEKELERIRKTLKG